MTFIQATKEVFNNNTFWKKNGITAGFLFVLMCIFQIFHDKPNWYFVVFWTILWFFIYMLTDAFTFRRKVNKLLAAEKALEILEKSKDNE